MNSEERDSVNYRFSGYQLPMIQLDATGPSYIVATPHPYYRNQPEYWGHPFYPGYPNGDVIIPTTTGERGTLYPFLSTDPDT